MSQHVPDINRDKVAALEAEVERLTAYSLEQCADVKAHLAEIDGLRAQLAELAALIHYGTDCWDEMAYPTLFDAYYELVGHACCGTCGKVWLKQRKPPAAPAPQPYHCVQWYPMIGAPDGYNPCLLGNTRCCDSCKDREMPVDEPACPEGAAPPKEKSEQP